MPVLLLDFDHTLYPSTLPTLAHIDRRITLFIETHLGMGFAEADALRQSLCARHGTTLRGLMQSHGLDPHAYFDFIHQVDEACLPPPDAALRDWIMRLAWPAYVFTNARADWVERCFVAMGLDDLVGEGKPLLGILDLAFVDWVGKPHDSAFASIEAFVRERHADEARGVADLHLVDDRLDNLRTARERGWRTHWVRPAVVLGHDGESEAELAAGVSGGVTGDGLGGTPTLNSLFELALEGLHRGA